MISVELRLMDCDLEQIMSDEWNQELEDSKKRLDAREALLDKLQKALNEE